MPPPKHPADANETHVVLAVKDLLQAKTRLAGVLPTPGRAALVLAMLADTLQVCRQSPLVAAAHVVTRDGAVAEVAHQYGASVISDPAAEGLNPALEHAAASLGLAHVVALQPDLPALRPAELSAALAAAAERSRRCFTADRDGTGTTMLISHGTRLTALFGADSARRHRDSGAGELIGTWPGLRCDVDTLADLVAATRIGVGPATAAVLDGLGIPATVAEEDDAGVLLRADDGSAVHCAHSVITVSGWRRLRPGQRVRAHRDDNGEVVLLTMPAVNPPGWTVTQSPPRP